MHSRRIGSALGLTVALACAAAPATAHAQFVDRLSLSVHLGAGTILTQPQSNEYGLGGAGELRPGVRLAGPLHLHLLLSYAVWPVLSAANSSESIGVALMAGGGLRLAPEVSRSVGGPFLDADAAASFTGGNVGTRLGFNFGVGWLFPVARVVSLGPAVRAGSVVGSASDDAVNRSTLWYWRAGLEVVFHAGREEAAPPPPPVDPDPDHDGVPNPTDRCPNEPENLNSYQDEDGCPDDPDPDHDSVPLPTDRCPNEPETRNGFQDEDGCPDSPDLDGDGIVGAADSCPTDPETRNGFQDEDGCPDQPPPPPPPPVQLAGDHITINGTINFETDRDAILAESFPLLDQVVAILQAHPEIRKIRIEGHTDAQGRANRNLRLSRGRARAVENYLRGHGIDRRRLSSAGYGQRRLLTQGTTPEDHARNRRVEFFIIDPAGGVSATSAAGVANAPEAPAEEGRRGRRGRHGRRRH